VANAGYRGMNRHFGRYRISDEEKDELGRGGFGRVYRAFDPNLNHYVAIKVLSSGSDEDMIRRFQDESRTTCKLKHENIVQVYDFDLQDGMPYLVMQLLEGETLDKIVKSGTLAGRVVEFLDKVEIMLQVAKGLQYAHGENVIHRDIKPSNIMVQPNGLAKIMDFGIARVVDKDGTRRTRQGNLAGTILYMGPEQFKKEGDADKLTDIFAYGGMYYELLAGVHPFAADDLGTVVYRITSVEPAPIRQLVPECPEALSAVIAGLLTKDREFRTSKMEDVVRATQPILIGLKQKKAAEIASGIETLMAQDQTDLAEAAIGQALDLDPLNTVAQQWRQRLAERLRQKAKLARAEARAREAKDHLAARRFDAAVQSMEGALSLDPGNAELESRLETVKAQAAHVKDAIRMVADAGAQLRQDRLDAALELSSRAAELDPGNAEAVKMAADIRTRLRGRVEAQDIAQAEDLRVRGEYTGALEILDGLISGGATGSKVAALRALVERDRTEADRQKRAARFRTSLAGARELLYSRRVEESEAAAEALCREFPEESMAADFLSEVREYRAAQKRLAEVGNISQAARGLIRSNQLDEARKLLQNGLDSYPGDTTMHRLIEMVSALQAARDRVLTVDKIVLGARELIHAGRLDEAARAIDNAIVEFGQESELVECKRNIEFEKEHQDHVLALQKRLSEARRMLSEGRSQEAVDLLEETAFRYPGEPEVNALLISARSELAAALERDFTAKELARTATLEQAKQFAGALSALETALERFPHNPDLRIALARLRQKRHDQEAEQAVAAHLRSIEEAIRSGKWDAADASLEAARGEFPLHPALPSLTARIQEGRRRESLQLLQKRVEESCARWDLAEAERHLEAARSLSQETTWQLLRRQLDARQAYQTGLAAAQEAHGAGKLEEAERLLQPLLGSAPDGRAEALRRAIFKERREAEEQIRREAQIRIEREASERLRAERERAISAGRQEAAVASRAGDVRGAVALLNRLARQFEGNEEIRKDLESAEAKLAERVREEAARLAEQQAREEAIRQVVGVARQQAAELAAKGDVPAALAVLDSLAAQYPGRGEILADRRAIIEDAERRRSEQEAAALSRLEQELAERREEAARLARQGRFEEACAALDRLAQQYPGRPEIAADHAAVMRSWERQRWDEEEKARRQQEEAAVAQGCEEAAALVRIGNSQQAIARLDELGLRYPGNERIPVERQKAARAGERFAREERERTRLENARNDASDFLRTGDVASAIAILDRLLLEFPGNVKVQADRIAAGVEVERQNRERQERAERALTERGIRDPEPTPSAEYRMREALRSTTASLRALRMRHWHTPLVEFLATVWSLLVGAAAQIIALGYRVHETILPQRRGKVGLPDRFALASLRWTAERSPGNPTVESAQEGTLRLMVRRERKPDQIAPLSNNDITILTAIAGIGLIALLAGGSRLYTSFQEEVTTVPASVAFQYKFGSLPEAKAVALSRNLAFSVVAEQPWLTVSKAASGISVKIGSALAPGSYQGSFRIELHSWRARNRSIRVPVSVTVSDPMRITPDKVSLVSPGAVSQTLKVSSTGNFSVSSNQHWLKAEKRGQTIVLTADPTATSQGRYPATVTVTDEENGALVYVQVVFQVLYKSL
jgi:serine/threonine-protein kinase